MSAKWDNDRINWKSLGEGFWLNCHFADMTISERRMFLRKNHLEYIRDVPRCRECQHAYYKCVCQNKAFKEKMKLSLAEYNKPFDGKLKFSQEMVNRVLEMIQKYNLKAYIAYSAGIDSECCVQLFKDAIKDRKIQVVWNDTLVEFPETRTRITELEEELGIKILRITPEKGVSFKTVVEKYGLPLYSRASVKEKRFPTLKCCYLLKKKPMKQIEKNYDISIMGLRIEENQYRRALLFNRGACFYSTSHNLWRVYPIAYWKIEDVWKFQEKMDFNFNQLYNHSNCNRSGFYCLKSGAIHQIRTGCWSCPQARESGYLEWLQVYQPKLFNALMENFGLRKIMEANNEKIEGKGISAYKRIKDYIAENPEQTAKDGLKALNLNYEKFEFTYGVTKNKLKKA